MSSIWAVLKFRACLRSPFSNFSSFISLLCFSSAFRSLISSFRLFTFFKISFNVLRSVSVKLVFDAGLQGMLTRQYRFTLVRQFCVNWFQNKIEGDPDFLNHVWFSDEAHFMLSGHVNSKNNVFWGTQAPEEVLQRPLYSLKCTAWVAISKHGIIGPYWFEDENEKALTVTKERYIVVLNKFWMDLEIQQGINRNVQWFQQDGATPHTANITLEWLDERFSDRLISRRRDTEWSPHSPDLSPPDFYLWGLLKDRVYQNNPKTIAEWKLAITQNICAIKREECARVIDNFARRLQECLRRNGGHLEHVLK